MKHYFRFFVDVAVSAAVSLEGGCKRPVKQVAIYLASSLALGTGD